MSESSYLFSLNMSSEPTEFYDQFETIHIMNQLIKEAIGFISEIEDSGSFKHAEPYDCDSFYKQENGLWKLKETLFTEREKNLIIHTIDLVCQTNLAIINFGKHYIELKNKTKELEKKIKYMGI
jgi:hypothetical protein